MIVRLLVLSALSAPPAFAWNLKKDLEKLGKQTAQDLQDLGKKAGKEINNGIRDVQQHLAGGFKPLSRSLSEPITEDTYWMGVVGDSSVTGAVASPRFHVTAERIGQFFGDIAISKDDPKLEARVEDFADPAKFNVFAPIDKLTRVLYTRAEFDRERKNNGGLDLALQTKFSKAADTEEYAFPYLIGRALSIPASHIVLAAQDGKKVSAMGEQLRRLLEGSGSQTLPPLLLMSFVANDLCHPDNFDRPPSHFRENYARDVHEQFVELAKFPPSKQGTRVMFVAPLDVSFVLSSDELLNQRVKFEGTRDATCRSIQDGSGVHGDLAKRFQEKLIGACRGILSPDGNPAAKIERVRQLQIAQLEIVQAEIAAFRAEGIRVELAASSKSLAFKSGDIANDCFHPSPRGHERIAETLLLNEFSRGRPQ